MCGILAWVSKEPLSPEKFDKALDTHRYRGPDGQGSWLSENKKIALGHRRLAIVSNDGHQPLKNEKGNIVAIVNGEFYEYRKIRKRLEAKGHRFQTKSDSEILIHLYEEYGQACVHHLQGEFAFILWDREKEILFAGRDRFGVKPLLYSELSGDFFIASKAKAIMEITEHRKWNRRALFASLHHQYAPPEESLFDGIRSLAPGHTLELCRGVLKIERYWDFRAQENESEKSLEFLLKGAVEKRLQGDAKITCSLSGGIDSSSIAALLSKMQNDSEAFTVNFSEAKNNIEHVEAQRVANFLNIKLHTLHLRALDVFESLSAAVFHSEGLAINAHLSAKYLLAKRIADENYKVVLSGEGADEIFYGYPHLRQDIFGNNANSIQTFDSVSRGVMVAEENTNSELDSLLKLGFVPSFFKAKLALGTRAISQTRTQLKRELQEFDPTFLLEGFQREDIPKNKARGSAYLWAKLALEKYILSTLGDGTEMAHGVEGRTPFLDDEVVAKGLSFRPESCFRDGMEKIQLREAMKGYLPVETLRRHKQPFIGPPLSFESSVKEKILDELKGLEDSSIWDGRRLAKTWLEKSTAPLLEQQKWDPIFMLALSTLEIEKQFNLDAL